MQNSQDFIKQLQIKPPTSEKTVQTEGNSPPKQEDSIKIFASISQLPNALKLSILKLSMTGIFQTWNSDSKTHEKTVTSYDQAYDKLASYYRANFKVLDLMDLRTKDFQMEITTRFTFQDAKFRYEEPLAPVLKPKTTKGSQEEEMYTTEQMVSLPGELSSSSSSGKTVVVKSLMAINKPKPPNRQSTLPLISPKKTEKESSVTLIRQVVGESSMQ